MHPTQSTTTTTSTTPAIVPQNVEPTREVQHPETLEAVSSPATTATSAATSEKVQQQENEARQRIENAIKESEKPSRVETTPEQLQQINAKTNQLIGKFLPFIQQVLPPIIAGNSLAVRNQLDTTQSAFEKKNDKEEKALLTHVSKMLSTLAEAGQYGDFPTIVCKALQYNDSTELFKAMLTLFIEEHTKEIKTISQQFVDDVIAVYANYSPEEVLQKTLEEHYVPGLSSSNTNVGSSNTNNADSSNANNAEKTTVPETTTILGNEIKPTTQKAHQPTLVIDLPEDPETIQEIIATGLNTKSPTKVEIRLQNPDQMAPLSWSLINNDSIKELTLNLELKTSNNYCTLEETPSGIVENIVTYYDALSKIFQKCPNATKITLFPAFPEYASYELMLLDALITATEDTPTLQKIVFEAPASYQKREDVKEWFSDMKETHKSKFEVK